MSELPLPPSTPLYSIPSIGISAFIGGPLGASYTIGQNFKALGRPSNAKSTYWIGLLITVGLALFLILAPKEQVEKIPQIAIPILTVTTAVGIAHYFQGIALEQQYNSGNPAISILKAIGASIVALIITVGLIVGMTLLYGLVGGKSDTTYTRQLERFDENEAKSLAIYKLLEEKSSDSLLIQELEQNGIPLWEENVAIARSFQSIKDLDDPENDVSNLVEYAELRLKIFVMMRKSFIDQTDFYKLELQTLEQKLKTVMER